MRPTALLCRRRRQRKLLRLRRDGGWRRRHSRSGGGGGGGRVKRRGRLELAGEVDQDSARWNGGVVQTAEEGVGAWEEVRRRRRISQDPFCTGVVYSALQKTPLNGTGWPACHAAWGCLEGGWSSRVNFRSGMRTRMEFGGLVNQKRLAGPRPRGDRLEVGDVGPTRIIGSTSARA